MMRPMRRALAILSVVMITAGCVVLSDAALTIAWKEPVSAIYGQLRQNEAEDQLRQLQADFLEGLETEKPIGGAGALEQAAELADRFTERLEKGKAIGRIEIESADIDYVVVEGTDTGTLKKGPGHYPETALPGQGKTIGIAGHRTTYGAPFNDIDSIEDGDEIVVEMPYATFTYEVEKTEVVAPTEVRIIRDIGRERLVLTACHPLYSAAERYAVFGKLTDVVLAEGAAVG
jgi:sortase A